MTIDEALKYIESKKYEVSCVKEGRKYHAEVIGKPYKNNNSGWRLRPCYSASAYTFREAVIKAVEVAEEKSLK